MTHKWSFLNLSHKGSMTVVRYVYWMARKKDMKKRGGHDTDNSGLVFYRSQPVQSGFNNVEKLKTLIFDQNITQ